MQLPQDTTIVVTDGKKLRLFRNTGNELQLKLMELPKPDVYGDAEGASGHQHSSQTTRDHQESNFGQAVAKWLNHEIASGKIGQLVVMAPPRALGELRQHYSETLKKRLVGELAKEHTNDSSHHLEQVLKDA